MYVSRTSVTDLCRRLKLPEQSSLEPRDIHRDGDGRDIPSHDMPNHYE
jgi:hypothetical protein